LDIVFSNYQLHLEHLSPSSGSDAEHGVHERDLPGVIPFRRGLLE
jgi:hypothetical protein